MRAVMYHYVRDYCARSPHFLYLDRKNFVRQLNYFKENYSFLTLEECVMCFKDGERINHKDKIFLTFDDGLIDHYKIVYPLLREMGLWGIFYVPLAPVKDGVFLDVHKIHAITGEVTADRLIRQLDSIVEPSMILPSHIEHFKNKTYLNHVNSRALTEIKRILNYYIDEQYRRVVIDKLASLNNITFEAEKFYMSEQNLVEMSDNGMIIGSHTINHPVLSKLQEAEQSFEIEGSFEFLDGILGARAVRTFCYPYGGPHTYNDTTIRILNSCRVDFSVSVEARDITDIDLISKKQELPRFDCNSFPFGKVSGL